MKYTFERLQEHTEMIRADSLPLVSKNKSAWDNAVSLFSEYFQKLEESPKTTDRNVKMLLATRFMNLVRYLYNVHNI